MIVNIIILFISFFILVKSSDYFVKSSSSIAKSLGVSELVIGLTLVAIGTSIPELASSIVAALNGSGSIVIGNVVGSNIANIALIIGLSAIVSTIPKNKGIVVKDGYIMLFITALILLTLYDLKLTMVEGIILFILYLSYLMFLLEKKDNKEDEEKSSNFKSYINYVFLFKYLKNFKILFLKREKFKEEKKEYHSAILKNILIIILSIGGIVLGAKFLIIQAIFFAKLFSLSEVFVGLTIIAIGTSLPELSVTISAIRNGFSDIAIGNIIGSNIANILLVAGVSSFFSNLSILRMSYNIIMPYLFGITLLFLVLLKYRGISKTNGVIFLMIYFSFITTSFLF